VKAVFGRTVGLLPKPANEPEKLNGEKAVDATGSYEDRASWLSEFLRPKVSLP
jgi:hypothetical protein